jgi:hypothetical protein
MNVITASDLTDPPKGLFADISQSYDFSVYTYFSILKWSFYLLFGYFIFMLPNIYFCSSGNCKYELFFY